MDWPKYRNGLWQQLLQLAQRAEKKELSAPIVAVDNNPRAIAAARQNLAAAGLSEHVQLACQPMQELSAGSATGLLICNPPYGERIGRTAALLALYRDLGRISTTVFAAWQSAVVCPDSELVRATGIAYSTRLRFSNGGIRVALQKSPESHG
jgi:putative N6-adenine-specific DNA methylase